MGELSDDSVYDQQADLCKVFSNAKRLKLLELLKEGEEYTVSELQAASDIPQSTVSRHLKLMRDRGVVRKRNDGVHNYYALADNRIATSMDLMREILFDQIDRERELASTSQ